MFTSFHKMDFQNMEIPVVVPYDIVYGNKYLLRLGIKNSGGYYLVDKYDIFIFSSTTPIPDKIFLPTLWF